MLETGFPQRFAAEPFFFVGLVLLQTGVSNAGRNKILRIHINWKFQLELEGICVQKTWKMWRVFCTLEVAAKVGRFVKDQSDAEENDAFTTSAYHSWRV